MPPSTRCFEVVAIPKVGVQKEYVLRRFRDHQAAAKFVLAADMVQWDDIWVRPSVRPTKHATNSDAGLAPKPWSVAWGSMHTYLLDASGKRLAALVGPPDQRQHVAGMIIAAMQEDESHANGQTRSAPAREGGAVVA